MINKKALILASVGSMIQQFNMPNIKLLITMGYEVSVACNFKKGNTSSTEQADKLKTELLEMNVSCHQIDFNRNPMKLSDNKKAYNQVRSLMEREKYEFVHCHSPIGGVVSRIAGKATKTKVIYTGHGFHFFKGAPIKNWLLYYPIEKLLSKKTDVLITINEEDYNLATKKKFKAKRIEHIKGIGINLDKFLPQTLETKNKLREEYSYSPDDFILIYVAELSYRKNQELLIKAVSKLTDQIPNIKLLLVGLGDFHDKYSELIKNLAIEDKVELLGYRNDVPSLMQLADLAVSASRQEGLPVNVMEAMATGLPLVVSNCRGNRDLVVDGKNGYVYDLKDTNKLSDSLINLYKDKELRSKFSKNSLAMINQYSVDNIMAKTREIYSYISEL